MIDFIYRLYSIFTSCSVTTLEETLLFLLLFIYSLFAFSTSSGRLVLLRRIILFKVESVCAAPAQHSGIFHSHVPFSVPPLVSVIELLCECALSW